MPRSALGSRWLEGLRFCVHARRHRPRPSTTSFPKSRTRFTLCSQRILDDLFFPRPLGHPRRHRSDAAGRPAGNGRFRPFGGVVGRRGAFLTGCPAGFGRSRPAAGRLCRLRYLSAGFCGLSSALGPPGSRSTALRTRRQPVAGDRGPARSGRMPATCFRRVAAVPESTTLSMINDPRSMGSGRRGGPPGNRRRST